MTPEVQTPHDLFQSHRHLVAITLRKLYTPPPPRVAAEDLESAGLLGLWKASERYDPGKGVQFKTFAVSSIRFAMKELLREEAWAPRSAFERNEVLLETVSLDVRAGRSEDRIVDLIPDPGPTPEEILFPPDDRSEADRRLVARVLLALPKRERRLLWLWKVRKVRYQDIAVRTGWTESWTRHRLHRALLAARGVAAGW